MRSSGTFEVMDVRAALKEAMVSLREADVGSPALAAELLLMHVLERDRAWLYAHAEESLDPAVTERYFDLVARRASGTPTQYLTGRQEFWGLEFEVTPEVLIPRPETEHVVEVALERLGRQGSQRKLDPSPHGASLRAADVGTGSGCLSIALAREWAGAKVFATDTSAGALQVARRNAARHGVAGRVYLVQCNLLDAFDCPGLPPQSESVSTLPHSIAGPRFHLIVSNPPYVGRIEAETLPREVREHEPHTALFAGEQGPEIYAPLLDQATRLLLPGGVVVLELGYNVLATVRAWVDSSTCWRNISVTKDLAGIPRVLAAERS